MIEYMQVPFIETQHSNDTCIYSVTHAHTLVHTYVHTLEYAPPPPPSRFFFFMRKIKKARSICDMYNIYIYKANEGGEG